jgi:hypothetical protein
MVVSEFAAGQRVEHSSCGPGVVRRIEDGCVYVSYDSGGSFGIYDNKWFRACNPRGIYLRPTDTPAQSDVRP